MDFKKSVLNKISVVLMNMSVILHIIVFLNSY